VMPGVTLDLAAHREGWAAIKAAKTAAAADAESQV
jgi:hypothetical protein